jgi:hypothetical protein
VDRELDSLDRPGTWNLVDKVEGGKKVGSKWVFKVKRLVDGSIDKFKARLVAQGFTQCLGFDFAKLTPPLFVLIPCGYYFPLRQYKVSLYSKWI